MASVMLEMREIDVRRIRELPLGARAFLYAAVQLKLEADAEHSKEVASRLGRRR